LEEVVSAARMLPQAQFIFRGSGVLEPKLRSLAQQLGVTDRVRFAPPVDVDALVSSASESDIGLNPFPPVCHNTQFVLPNKFFEYMMAGLAMGSTDLPELRTLTDQLQLGVLFDRCSPESIAAGLSDLLRDEDRLEHCRLNSYAAARDVYYWERVKREMLSYYEGVIGGSSAD
jgi:glycosyltransferase involved in cell wall biosynthesis